MEVTKDFPVLARQVNGKPLIYLDSAATSQMPTAVLDEIADFDRNFRANVHRGVHALSLEASEKYDRARGEIADFIGANEPAEVIFTRNATESINLVVSGWAKQNVGYGDRVLVTVAEHHSNFVPWQQFCTEVSAELLVLDVDKQGILDLSDFEQKLDGVKLVAINHASNVLGTINPIAYMAELAHKHGALVLVDGAQAAPHLSVNMKDLGADFYALSGHKMLGPMGLGVLWARRELLEEMKPYQYGGDMISEVHINESKWNDLPYKFEAGTPNVSGAIGMAAACKFLSDFGMDNVRAHEIELLEYALPKLRETGVELIGPSEATAKTGIITFNLPGIHPHDVAQVLDSLGIAIRTGHHCAMPLHEFLGLESTCRASFYIYNDNSDVDALIEGLEKVKTVFK